MSKRSKAKPVDRATPVIKQSRRTDAAKVTVTRSTTTAMKAAPQWSTSPALQAASTAWNTAADAVESNAKIVANLKSQLAVADAAQRTNRQSWNVATKQMTALVAVTAEGSPDVVHALGFGVVTRAAPVAQVAPSGLNTAPGTVSGEAILTWKRGTARHGFLVQRAADPANPATFIAGVPCTKTKYMIDGAPPSTVVHFRVTAIDTTSSTGTSPWSDWVACTVR